METILEAIEVIPTNHGPVYRLRLYTGAGSIHTEPMVSIDLSAGKAVTLGGNVEFQPIIVLPLPTKRAKLKEVEHTDDNDPV